MDKKNLVILIIAIVLIASGMINTIITIIDELAPVKSRIVVGINSNIASIDPLDTWDTPSQVVEHQIVEGLVDYNYSDFPNYIIIPKLAVNWFWQNTTCISFQIRENVRFHDGTQLDAYAVKWNFDRLLWFCNYTGELPNNATSKEALPSTLFYFSDGKTPIINRTNAINSSIFTIWLNKPFVPILDLLTFSATYICSPSSTPRYRFLDPYNETLVGTGPFKFKHFKPDNEIRFEKNKRYWGKKPWAEILIFKIIEDDLSRMVAGATGQLDYVEGVTNDFISIFRANTTTFHVEDVGDDLSYFYLEFYCGSGDPALGNPWDYQQLNSTWRRALSLAINYSNIWNDIQDGLGYPGFPAISRSMPDFNSSLEGKMAHDFSFAVGIKKSRELMQSMGFGLELDTNYPGLNEISWTSASFRTLEVNQHYGNPNNQMINQLLENNWELIGINLNITIRTWYPPLYPSDISPWEMEVIFLEDSPSYLDAFNMIDDLFNNESIYSYSQISDPILKSLLKIGAETTDSPTRQNICEWIQSYIFDITRPENPSSYCHTPLWTYKVLQVHKNSLKGVGYNVVGMLDCWNWYKS